MDRQFSVPATSWHHPQGSLDCFLRRSRVVAVGRARGVGVGGGGRERDGKGSFSACNSLGDC